MMIQILTVDGGNLQSFTANGLMRELCRDLKLGPCEVLDAALLNLRVQFEAAKAVAAHKVQ